MIGVFSMHEKFNAEKLEKALMYRGITVNQLAQKMECSRQTISMYKNNKAKPTNIEFIQKLSKVLGFPVKFFLESGSKIDAGAVYFRSHLTTRPLYRAEQRQKMEFLASIYAFLKEYIEFPMLNIPDCSGLTPEESARILRKKWNLANEPIRNIIDLVESNGILVTTFATSTDAIDAFSEKIKIKDTGEDVFLIAYSSNKNSAARIHFDVAHELGHICMHSWEKQNYDLDPDEFRELEKEAHRFAIEFLMPQEAGIEDLKLTQLKIPEYTKLKRKWYVSIQAMLMRAKNLDVITYEEYKSMIITLQKRGLRKEEPLDNELLTSEPLLLRTAVMMLLNEGIFTPSSFLKELSKDYLLTISPVEVEYLLNLPKGVLSKSEIMEHPILKIKMS